MARSIAWHSAFASSGDLPQSSSAHLSLALHRENEDRAVTDTRADLDAVLAQDRDMTWAAMLQEHASDSRAGLHDVVDDAKSG